MFGTFNNRLSEAILTCTHNIYEAILTHTHNIMRIYRNIYMLGVFTEKPYSKPLERNVVYIPIITLSHTTSHDFE